MDNKVVIYGAGQYGRMALYHYKERVAYFIDSNAMLWGESIKGIKIRGLQDYIREQPGYQIIIATKQAVDVEEELKRNNIYNYQVYLHDAQSYYETDDVIFNVYEDNLNRNVNEEEYNKNLKNSQIRKYVNREVERLQGKELLIQHIEIETINRCNGNCSFCPVNKQADTRDFKVMSQSLFENIINQLADMKYKGKLALFSNNEPFLDPNIIARSKYARIKVPDAHIWMYTNGTLLKLELFKEIIDYLDEFVLDNYQENLKLIKPAAIIKQYCDEHPELKKKVTIALRNPNEILSTRGGDAPNRKEKISYGNDRCMLPYKQLIIRPDGKVSLCCNDPLGRNTLGDLTQNSILEIWNNDKFKMVRQCLYGGRKNWKHCEFCDHFGII